MSHEWHNGVLTSSSWHGLEQIGAMPDAESMIEHGYRSNAWPTAVTAEGLTSDSGIKAQHRAIVGSYESADPLVLGVVGTRYEATTPEQWGDLVKAAAAAGAQPTGAFALFGGSRVVATFDIGGDDEIRDQLVLADSFDGSSQLMGGLTSIRVVCANTMSAAMRRDGASWGKVRHTASLPERAAALEVAIGEAVKTGQKTRELYAQARETVLHRDDAMAAFDALFPEAPEDAKRTTQTRARKARAEARMAACLPINKVGDKGTLATLWNAATYLVDRKANGKPRGKNMLDSMLFGSRGQRVAQIQETIEIILRDGTTVPAHQAAEQGIKVGAAVLQSMLED